MTRKDYVALAEALKRSHMECDPAYTDQFWQSARAIADVLGHDNPRFDRARFLRACGLEG